MIEVGSPPALGAIDYQRLIISKNAAANCPRSCDFADFRFGSDTIDPSMSAARRLHTT
jgi:hypothetical protein